MPAPTPFSSAFQISTQNVNSQEQASVACLSDGRLVVVWKDQASTSGDIRFQILIPDGTPSGAEGAVNATTTGQQTAPSVAATSDGGFVVAWTTYATDASGDIAYRRFNPDGSAAMVSDGAATANTAGIQLDASVTAFANGTFAIGWNEGNTAVSGLSSSYAAMVRLFDSTGPAAAAFRISGNWGGEYGPRLTTDGVNLLAAWDDSSGPSNTQNGEDGIYSRLILGALPTTNYTDGGTRIDSGTFREASMDPDVALAGAGSVVVFDDVTTGTVGRDVFLNLGGTLTRVNTTTTGDQDQAAVAALADGGFVVVWRDLGAAGGSDIRARVYDATGTATSDDFLVTDPGLPSSGAQFLPDVVGLSDGRFLVVWSDGASDQGINGRLFDGRAAPITWVGGEAGEMAYGTAFAAGDTMTGNEGNDSIFGLAGADVIWGGSGENRLDGGRGSDTLDYSALGMTLDITLRGATFSRVVIGADTIDRFRNFENVIGGASDDRIIGDAAANRLQGRSGGDLLDGGLGSDTLTGGIMGDLFVFSTAASSANRDEITDFRSGTDTIALKASVFAALGPTLDGGEFIAAAAAQEADDRLIWDAASRILFYDADGNGAGLAQAICRLNPAATLAFTDLALI